MFRVRLPVFALLVVTLCGSVAAEEPVLRKEWEASPEAYFMTREERREWELVTTDAAARDFIAAFRARRGADFAAEVRKRAALIDERLALGEVKASATLRGKIAILLGAPRQLGVRHIPTATVGNTSHPLGTRKGSAGGDRPPEESLIGNAAGWVEYTFRYAPNPSLGIPAKGWVVVIEANAASGKDRLRSRREKKALDEILDAAARRSILKR